MAMKIPPELKKITPFVRRAEELDKDKSNAESRLVSYYCRQYAVSLGIPLATSAEGKASLGDLLNELEKEKTIMSNFSRDESKYLCRQFADKIFDKADQEDRSGNANKGTARTFYAAASFFEILQQFYGEEPSEEQTEEKKKTVYSKWKATEILKAIKEGRKPEPGGYGQNEDAPEDDDEEEKDIAVAPPADDLPPPPSANVFVPPPVAPSSLGPPPTVLPDDDEGTEVELGPPPSFPSDEASTSEHFIPPPVAPPAPKPKPTPTKQKSKGIFGMGKKKPPKASGKATKQQIQDASELTKFAMAALESKDPNLAAQRLRQALEALGQDA